MLVVLAGLAFWGIGALFGGGGGLSAQDVYEDITTLYPAPNPRDNTGSCEGDDGCDQLITTDAVSIYQWKTEDQAVRFSETFTGGEGNVDGRRVGEFVLIFDYRGTQDMTSDEARDAYEARLRELVSAE